MKRKRFIEEQIIDILKEAESGIPVNEITGSTVSPRAHISAVSQNLVVWISARPNALRPWRPRIVV